MSIPDWLSPVAPLLKRKKKRKRTKITPELVREIRDSKETPTAIAKRLNIDRTNVNTIRSRRSWKEIE